MKALMKKVRGVELFPVICGTLFLASGAVIAPINHYLMSAILLLAAVGLYLYTVFVITEKNWLDIRAIFTGIWLFTIGLASLRLLAYQESWQTMTWIWNAVAYAAFQVGAWTESLARDNVCNCLKKKIDRLKYIGIEMKEERLFWICIGVVIIGLASFLINIYIKKFLPLFSNDPNAYLDFYTRFHVFSVASTMISGLCYYCIKKGNLGRFKKIILAVCIVYVTILFPALVVSRGTFLTAAISLVTAIFYLNGRKMHVFLLSMVVVLGCYVMMSSARSYTDAQLDGIFEPSEIIIPEPGQDENDENVNTFVLPGKVAFIYSYLTIGHDNFNEAVQNSEKMTYGIRQLAPFNVIFRSEKITEVINEGEQYLVRPHLNTTSLIGDFYYDLHGFGVTFFMFLWGFVFSVIQSIYLKGKGPFALGALGNAMTPVMLCFFASWMGNFSHWMHWGLCFLMWLVACVRIIPKRVKD